jgi:hypothetical protein
MIQHLLEIHGDLDRTNAHTPATITEEEVVRARNENYNRSVVESPRNDRHYFPYIK